MNIQHSPFTCQRDGLTIRGMQYLPANFRDGEQYPAMIFSHGFMGCYQDMMGFCEDFAAQGYATFCFSFCGGSALDRPAAFLSDGASTDMCLASEVADLHAVMAYARSLPHVDASRLILFGGSQGGFVSGLTAGCYPEEVYRLVMLFPALCIPDHARQGCLGGARYDAQAVPERIDCGRITLGRLFHEEAAAMDPYLELARYKGPVLILHGIEDPVVNYAYSIRARENYAPGQCQLQLIRNMGHGTDPAQYHSVVASTRQFLNGRTEVLTIRVILTEREDDKDGDELIARLYFTGYCETPWFCGAVLPGACDTQRSTDGKNWRLHAVYRLDGLDCAGQRCFIDIVNEFRDGEWTPTVVTDSEALAWLNTAPLTAVLEPGAGGPNVRIYAKDVVR